MASGRVSMVEPSVRSGVRPAYPVFILFLNFADSPAKPFYGGRTTGERLLGAAVQRALAARDVHPMQAAFAVAVPLDWAEEE